MTSKQPTVTAAAGASTATVFGSQDFGEDKAVVRRLLEAKLPAEYLSTRVGAGKARFTYVESWRAIEIANSIFGFDGWSSSVVDITPDFVEEVAGKFKCGVTAIVRVTLKNGSFHEDVGFGMSENRCKGSAIENAKKEAVSDARKRALRVYGNALGNSVYDRDYIDSVKVPAKKGLTPVSYDQVRHGIGTPSAVVASPQVSPKPIIKTETTTAPLATVTGAKIPDGDAAAAAAMLMEDDAEAAATDFAIDTALLDQLHQIEQQGPPSDTSTTADATEGEPPNKKTRASM